MVVYKDLGLVAQVFDEPTLASLRGHLAIGHTRYSTTGGSTWENAQPTLRATTGRHDDRAGPQRQPGQHRRAGPRGRRARPRGRPGATSDTALVTTLLASRPDLSVEAAALEVLPTLRGAFSFVFMDEDTLYAARDAHGVRPLVLGRLERGWVVASETAALDIVGASFVREVEPGELIAIDEHGLRSTRFAAPEPKGCLFEYVYLARPDTTIAGRNVYSARVEIGRRLAKEHPVEADLVIPVPESGTPAAIGYAEASGIPYSAGLMKNAYVGRTFIQPSQTIRQLGIRLKLNPLREVVRGKRLVVVDDSIVRGNTQRAHGADAARGRRARGARAHLVAAGEVAVLLRHRLRHPGRADRQRPGHRRHPALDRRRLAGLRLAGRPDRRDRAAEDAALPGLLRRGVPDRAAGRQPDRQARARRGRQAGRDAATPPRSRRRPRSPSSRRRTTPRRASGRPTRSSRP